MKKTPSIKDLVTVTTPKGWREVTSKDTCGSPGLMRILPDGSVEYVYFLPSK